MKTKQIFQIAEFNSQGRLRLLVKEYATYPDAEKGIDELLEIYPERRYQIQKTYRRDDSD